MDEFSVIERFFKQQRVQRDDVPLGIGDDAAVVRAPAGSELAITTDVLVSGVHFPENTEPAAIGHKALAVNLSDLAAMGAAPAWATLGLTIPRIEESWLAGFSSGFLGLAEAFDVQLVGGDTTGGSLTIAVQLTGILDGERYLTRSGANEGDAIYVSGTLGDAAMGLRARNTASDRPESDHAYFIERLNRPTPRVALGLSLVGHATAAIDVSDGLAADLGHLCAASGIGAVVDVSELPLSEAYRRVLPKVGRGPALTFGDDYELCFTVASNDAPEVERLARGIGVAVTRIGHMTGHKLNWLEAGQPFEPGEYGYQHFR